MRTSFKKLTSIFLAVLMLVSAFSVVTASAAETDKHATGGDVIVDVSAADDPVNPSSWFAWTWGDGEGHWVNGYGDDATAVHFDGLDSMVKFIRMPWGSEPDWNGTIWNETGDLSVDGSYLRFFWTENYGEVGYEWSGDPDNPDNPDNPDDPIYGEYTVYLNPGDIGGDWVAWSFDGGLNGEFVYGSDDGGVIRFDNVASNVIFVNTTDGSWSGRIGQTATLYTEDGSTYVLDGGSMPTENEFGESFDEYSGDWSSDPIIDDPTDEPTDDPYEPTDAPTDTPEPVTDAPTDTPEPVTDAPTDTPEPVTDEPTAAPTSGDSDEGALTAVIKLNGAEIKKQEINGDKLVVTYNLTAPELVVDGQASLTYNKAKLTLESWEFPVVDASVIDNLDEGLFNFSSVKKPYDFTKGDKLVVCNFKVTDGAQGEASVNLQIEELDSADTVYAANSEIKPEGQSVIDSMKNVDVDAGTPVETTTDQEPTESKTDVVPEPTETDAPTPTDEPTTPPTAVPTTPPTAAPTTIAPQTDAPTTAPATQAPTAAPTTKATQPTTKAVKAAPNLKGTPNADAAVAYVKALKNDKDPSGSTFGLLKAKAKKVTKNSIKVTWSKVKGAKKYIVMGNKCGSSYKQLKTTTAKSFTQKGLKKGTYYKYMILAVNAKNKVIAVAKTLHVATKGGKVGNYKSIKITNAKSTFTLKKGKKFTLKTKAVKADKKVKNHRKTKFESSNSKVVKVSASGKITAKKKGTATIYAYAQNGVFAKLKVKVK